jgi:hypothetical protein
MQVLNFEFFTSYCFYCVQECFAIFTFDLNENYIFILGAHLIY